MDGRVQHVSLGRVLALSRLIWGAVFLSMFAMTAIVFVKGGGNGAVAADPTRIPPLTMFGPIAAVIGGCSIVIPMIVRRASVGKVVGPNAIVPFVLGPALTEPIVILGFIRVTLGAPVEEFYPFLVGAVLLMLFHFPREARR